MRKHKQRRIFSLVLTFVVLLCVSGLHAFAATVTQDGLEVTLVTDKAEYSANEQIKTTLTVKNNNDTAVENVDLETAIPEGYILADKSENKKTVESVAAGESVSLEVTLTKKATPDEPSTDPKSSTDPVSGGNNGGSGTTTGGTTVGGTTSGAAVQTGQSGLVFAICLIAMLLSLAAIWFFKTHGEIKNKNTVKRIISLVLCTSVLSGTLFASGLPAFAEETDISGKSLTISEEIKVGETKLIISANVVYNKEDKTVDDNITKLSDDMYITNPQAEHVRYDEESGIPYIDNEILITFNQDVDEATIEAFVSSLGGTIIGKIAPTNTYQVQVPVCEKFADVENFIALIEANELVAFASPDILIIEEPDYEPNDTEWENEWDIIPKGVNWGVEAINAPGAWEYMDYMQDTNIGVYDNQFLEHEDLRFEDIVFNSIIDKKIKSYEHGTHVAGTIGAGFDNGTGISGIAPKARLYGWGFNRSDKAFSKEITEKYLGVADDRFETNITTLISYEYSLTYLVSIKKCRAINYSCGFIPELNFAAVKGNPKALKYFEYCSYEMKKYLKEMIENNPAFNIIVSAGNNNEKYYLSDPLASQDFPYFGYRQSLLPDSTIADKGILDTKFNNIFSNIEDEEIKERIIVVGAIENKTDIHEEKYAVCDFSQRGNRVDVVAPGEDIESTVDNNNYGPMGGTSMAAPHVTGIAAMLFSLNPDIKADEVKQIICETADREVDGYKLVNAEAAVKAVMGTGTIGGKVVSAKDGSALSDVKITAYQKLKSGLFPVEFNTNDQGGFSKELISGNYEFDFEKEGYQPLTMDITVDKNVITLLQFNIELKPKTQSLIPPTWQKRNDDKIYFYIDPSLSAWKHMDTRMKNTAVYIYEYSYDNGISNKLEMYPWHSRQGKMVYEGDNIWSYDLLSHHIEIDPEKQYGLSFVYDWDSDHTRTSELIFNKDCLGDLVYMTGERTGINLDIDPSRFTVKWVNADNSLYAPPIYIDYSGTVVGEVYWKNRTPYNIFLEFLSSDAEININKALKYSGKNTINTLNDIAQELKLTEKEKQKAYQESGFNKLY